MDYNHLQMAGLKEAADILGWSKQQITNYLKRAEGKEFPPGMFPKPVQRIASGPLWFVWQIEDYKNKKHGGGKMYTVSSVQFEWIGKRLTVKNVTDTKGYPVVTEAPGQTRPIVIVENDMVVGFDDQGLGLEFPEFEPFPLPKENQTHKFASISHLRRGNAWKVASTAARGLVGPGSALVPDYQKRIDHVKAELADYGDKELEEYVLKSLDAFVAALKKGVIDYTFTYMDPK